MANHDHVPPFLVIIFVVLVVVAAATPAVVLLLWYLHRRRQAHALPQPPDRAPIAEESGPEAAQVPVEAVQEPLPTPPIPALIGLKPASPVVLIHGLLGFDHLDLLGQRVTYFRGVAEALRAEGLTVYVPRLPPLASVPARANILAAFIRQLPSSARVHLVAHSMGGLDSRYALAQLGLEPRVASLVTIATPHRGSPLADLGAAAPARALRGLIGHVGLATEAIDWLTTRRLKQFNREMVDRPGVLYGSIVGRSTIGVVRSNPVLWSGHAYLAMLGGPNDGMVPAYSQRWGEILDEIEADHWAQIGWSTYFNANQIYLRLYETLCRRGL